MKLLLHIRNIFFVFSHYDGWLRKCGLYFPSCLYFILNRKPWLDNLMFIITLECSNVNMNGNILQRYFTRISRGTNNFVQHVFENKFEISIVLVQWKVRFFFYKRSKALIMQVYFQSLLWSYLPRVPIILTTTVALANGLCNDTIRRLFSRVVPIPILVSEIPPIPPNNLASLSASTWTHVLIRYHVLTRDLQ